MIVLAIGLKLKAEGRDDFISAAQKMVVESNKEDGCVLYEFATDISDPNVIRIGEIWKTPEALQEHSASEHMATFQKATQGKVEASLYFHNLVTKHD